MYQVSETLAEALRDAHTIAISADSVEIPSRDVVRVVHSAALCGGELGIGGVNAACVEVSLSAKYDLSGKTLDISIGAGEPLEWMPLGVFAVTDTAQTDSGTTATAYDAAYYSTGTGYSPTVSSGSTVAAVAEDVCRQCGITLGALPAAAQTTTVTGTLTGHSCRDMIGYLAGLLGRNALISRDNRLEFRWLAQVGQTVSPAEYYSGKLSQSDVFEVVGVQCDKKTTKTVTDPETGTKTETDETVTLTSGGGTGKIIKFENPYMTQTTLDAVYNGIKGLRFHTGGFSAVHGILTEPGDMMTVTALDGAVYSVPALAVRLELDGGCRLTVDAPGTSSITDNAQFVSAYDKALEALEIAVGRFVQVYAENLEAEKAYIKKLTADSVEALEITVGQIGQDVKASLQAAQAAQEAAESAEDTADSASSVASSVRRSVLNWAYDAGLTYIDGGSIYTGTITTSQLAANSVTAVELAAGSVTADAIAAGAITADKMTTGILQDSQGKNVWNLNTGQMRTKKISIENGIFGSDDDGFTISGDGITRTFIDPNDSQHMVRESIRTADTAHPNKRVFVVEETFMGDGETLGRSNWRENFSVRGNGYVTAENVRIGNVLAFEKTDDPWNGFSVLSNAGILSSGGYLVEANQNWAFSKKISGTITNADTASSATNAGYATSAGSASSATSAGKATNNSTGFSIPEIQKGTVSITPSAANTPTSKAVSFSKSFSGTPVVTVTPSTGAPGTIVTGTAALSPSKSSFSAYLTRTNTTRTSLYWIAVY